MITPEYHLSNQLFVFDFDSTLGKIPPKSDNAMISLLSRELSADPNQLEYEMRELITPYSLSSHISLHLKQTDANFEQVLHKTNLLLQQEFENILYPDTIPTLKLLKQKGAITSVVTYGGEDYQKIKLESSGVLPFLDSYHITHSFGEKHKYISDLMLIHNPTHTTYIDNSLEQLRLLENLLPNIKLVLINRSNNDSNFQGLMIRDLKELLPL